MAMDKYQLLNLLKEFYNEDDQCGGNCLRCDMDEACEKLNPMLDRIFSSESTGQKNITTEQNSGELSVKEHRENNLRYRMEIMKRIKS